VENIMAVVDQRYLCGPAQVCSESCIKIKLYASETVVNDIMEILGNREDTDLSDFQTRYYKQPEVIATMQRMAYLVEYCRFSRTNTLEILNEDGETTHILDLTSLNLMPKKCSRGTCISKAEINCSTCLITYWCNATCLEQGYDSRKHKILCEEATKHLKGLFPDDY
jgi:hypothetical protein